MFGQDKPNAPEAARKWDHYREFDGVGHFLFLEKPKEFNAALAEFLTMVKLLK